MIYRTILPCYTDDKKAVWGDKMKAIRDFLGRKRVWMLFGLIWIFLSATVIELVIAFIIKTTIDVNSDIHLFLSYFPLLLLLSILYGIAKFTASKLSANYAAKMVKKEKVQLTEHIQKLPLTTVKKLNVGELYTVLHENMNLLEEFLVLLPRALSAPLVLGMTLLIMFFFSWKLTLVCIISIPIPTLLFGIINKPIEKRSAENQKYITDVNGFLRSTIEGIDMIKTYNLYHHFADGFSKLLNRVESKEIEMEMIKAKTTPLSYILRILPQCVIPLYSAYLALNGENTIGLLPAFSLLIGNIFIPIEALLNFSTQYRKTIVVIRRIQEVRLLGEERIGGDEPLLDGNPIVEFTGVSFAYNKTRVLNDITFNIVPGEQVAVIGESGSGKSTITKLICGLYDNYEGSVKVFQSEASRCDLTRLREQISVMPQTAFLLPGTIRENLLYGVSDTKTVELEQAADMTNLSEVTAKLSNGFDTVLEESGLNLSKGQRQRVAMTRIILQKTPIIILDEVTAGLDPVSVEMIKTTLNHLKRKHTIIMVTHDMELASKADKIILIHDHQLVKYGTHEELLKEPLYKDMCKVQF